MAALISSTLGVSSNRNFSSISSSTCVGKGQARGEEGREGVEVVRKKGEKKIEHGCKHNEETAITKKGNDTSGVSPRRHNWGRATETRPQNQRKVPTTHQCCLSLVPWRHTLGTLGQRRGHFASDRQEAGQKGRANRERPASVRENQRGANGTQQVGAVPRRGRQ